MRISVSTVRIYWVFRILVNAVRILGNADRIATAVKYVKLIRCNANKM